MTITVQDEALEERIREIGRRTGLAPADVIARAIEKEVVRTGAEGAETMRRRAEAGRRLRAELPTLTAEDRAAIDQAMRDMYDENGLPKF